MLTCISKEDDVFRPDLINIKVDGRNGYATSDLLSPHLLSQARGRLLDGTTVRSCTAQERRRILAHLVREHIYYERVSSLNLYAEAMLSKDLIDRSAAPFGRGRLHAGVLVQPKAPFELDPNDTKVADSRNLIL